MEPSNKFIQIETNIRASLRDVWAYWTLPQHILHWNSASDDWHTVSATNDLRVGGKLSSRMEAKDGSAGFDFWGIYDEIIPNQLIKITLGDDRKMEVHFSQIDDSVQVIEIFEPEKENPIELQRNGWQSILDHFKIYVESLQKENTHD